MILSILSLFVFPFTNLHTSFVMFVRCLACWLVGWLAGWLVGWLPGRLNKNTKRWFRSCWAFLHCSSSCCFHGSAGSRSAYNTSTSTTPRSTSIFFFDRKRIKDPRKEQIPHTEDIIHTYKGRQCPAISTEGETHRAAAAKDW